MTTSYRRTAIAMLASSALLFSACSGNGDGPNGDAEGLTPLEFQLHWAGSGSTAGYIVAQTEGLYEEAGLDVTLNEGNGSGNTAQLVASGQADIASSDAVTVSQMIAQGADMRTIATIYQSAPSQITTLADSGIEEVEDLEGANIGVPSGGAQTTILPLVWDANDIDESQLQITNMPETSMVPALLQGEVDVILGSVDSYGIQLDQQDADTRNWLFADYGVSTVSTGIFADNDYLEENSEAVEAFVAASLEGWRLANEDPEAAAEAVKELFPESDEELTALEVEAIDPLLCSGEAQYVGKAEDEAWQLTQDLLSEVELLPEGEDPSDYYTHDYLPSDDALQPCEDGEPVQNAD